MKGNQSSFLGNLDCLVFEFYILFFPTRHFFSLIAKIKSFPWASSQNYRAYKENKKACGHMFLTLFSMYLRDNLWPSDTLRAFAIFFMIVLTWFTMFYSAMFLAFTFTKLIRCAEFSIKICYSAYTSGIPDLNILTSTRKVLFP